MPRARLSIGLPEPVWMHTVSRGHPDATFTVTSVLPREETAVAVVEVATPSPAAVLGDIEACDEVVAVDLLSATDDAALLQVETADPRLLGVAQTAGVALETPFEIHDGVATWELTTSTDRLSALGDALTRAGIDYDLEFRGDAADPALDPLTERQAEVVRRARDLGYYESPRRATLTEVAEALDIAKATCSDTLHRAESNLVDEYLAGREARTLDGESAEA